MADLRRSTDGPSPLSEEGYDESLLPDFDREFLSDAHLQAFTTALSAPEPSPSTDDLLSASQSRDQSHRGSIDLGRRRSVVGGEGSKSRDSLFITAQNDWAPVNPKRLIGSKNKRSKSEKKRGRTKRKPRRSRDETREGYLYTLLKWPLLGIVIAWVSGLGMSYMMTRLYIWTYEHFVAWRGRRNVLREELHSTTNYGDYVKAARELDTFLGNDRWKEVDEFAYYDSKTVKRVLEQMRRCRRTVEAETGKVEGGKERSEKAVEELKALVDACVKNNFGGVENPRLYSQTYYGTKNLVQEFMDEGMYDCYLCLIQC